MNQTEQHASDAQPGSLPLAAAAARLGISSDALRMRINRGKIRGFKRGGRLFAVLDEVPNRAPRTALGETEQTAPGRSEHTASGRSEQAAPGRSEQSAGAGPDAGALGPGALGAGEPALPLVVEFQKVELGRLLRDNERLNRRLDQFMEELRHLREMQQREQVLRQQDQALRQRGQALIERLIAAPIPAAPIPAAPVPVHPESEAQVSGTPQPAPPAPSVTASPIPPVSAPREAPASPAAGIPATPPPPPPDGAAPAGSLGSTVSGAKDTGEDTDLTWKEPQYAYDNNSPPPGMSPGTPPGTPPETSPGLAGELGGSREGARRDAAELADMLKDIGASLQDADSGPDLPQTAPPPTGAKGALPGTPPGARRAPGDFAGGPPAAPLAPRPVPAFAPPPAPPAAAGDDEAGLLEILGRMGPSAEERRTAGRLMKRLLRGRAARRRNEPGGEVD